VNHPVRTRMSGGVETASQIGYVSNSTWAARTFKDSAETNPSATPVSGNRLILPPIVTVSALDVSARRCPLEARKDS
jgi:hypothetical protein